MLSSFSISCERDEKEEEEEDARIEERGSSGKAVEESSSRAGGHSEKRIEPRLYTYRCSETRF